MMDVSQPTARRRFRTLGFNAYPTTLLIGEDELPVDTIRGGLDPDSLKQWLTNNKF